MLDGALRTLANYQFEDDEVPSRLSLVGSALLLESSQQFARYDLDQLTFSDQYYYKAPRTSGWMRLGALAMAAMAGGVNFINVMNARFGVTSLGSLYSYFYFENDNGGDARRFGFTRIERTTGEEAGTLWLNKRIPGVAFDSESGVIFANGDGTLEAFRFVD